MLSMEERLALVHELTKLREQLIGYQDRLVRELPLDLQEAVRSENVVQPITTSGLEQVAVIIDRINMAVYYYADPEFPGNHQSTAAAETKKQTVTPIPVQTKAVTLPPSGQAKQSDAARPLDFGPFDPRHNSRKGS